MLSASICCSFWLTAWYSAAIFESLMLVLMMYPPSSICASVKWYTVPQFGADHVEDVGVPDGGADALRHVVAEGGELQRRGLRAGRFPICTMPLIT